MPFNIVVLIAFFLFLDALSLFGFFKTTRYAIFGPMISQRKR